MDQQEGDKMARQLIGLSTYTNEADNETQSGTIVASGLQQ